MLTGKQRSYLKGLANQLKPLCIIGKNEITENVIKSIDMTLENHELVKVSIQEGVEIDPKQACNDLAEKLGAEFVQAIGRRFVLYRQAKDKDKRQIVLPRK